MKRMLVGLSVACLTGGYALFARGEGVASNVRTLSEPLPGGSSVTCWYDEAGVYTGYAPAPKGARSGEKVQTASSGPHAWSYTVSGNDPSACPATLPVETFTEH